MPIVSVNLSDNAWKCYKLWRNHGRSASKKVSQAIVRLWDQEDVVPSLQPGDLRTSVTGDEMVWTTEGWKLRGEEE